MKPRRCQRALGFDNLISSAGKTLLVPFMKEFCSGIDDLEVLFSSNDYVVVNKPPNVRMDGDGFDDSLENRIVRKLGGTKKDYKWIHQLDFATSGVLGVARNRNAARDACGAFSERSTAKEYHAIVLGHLVLDKALPLISDCEIVNSRVRLQKFHDDHCPHIDPTELSRRNNPAWHQDVKTENLKICMQALEKCIEAGVADENLLELSRLPWSDYENSSKLRKRLRKSIRALESTGKAPMIMDLYDSQAPSVPGSLPKKRSELMDPMKSTSSSNLDHSDNFESKNIESTQSSMEDINLLPINTQPFYREIYRYDVTNKDVEAQDSPVVESCVIFCPVAEIVDDFRCELGSLSNPGKYAETLVHVLEKAYIEDIPVTRLKLIPRTGRRHQLRLHCLALGHVIFGDGTYSPYQSEFQHHAVLNPEDSTDIESSPKLVENTKDLVRRMDQESPRMMLNASRLKYVKAVYRSQCKISVKYNVSDDDEDSIRA